MLALSEGQQDADLSACLLLGTALRHDWNRVSVPADAWFLIRRRAALASCDHGNPNPLVSLFPNFGDGCYWAHMLRSRLGRCIGVHFVCLTPHFSDPMNESAMEERLNQPGHEEAGTFPVQADITVQVHVLTIGVVTRNTEGPSL